MNKEELFREKIHRIRHATGLTMAEFAERIGVSEGTVSLWESGKAIPRKTTLTLIDKVFAAGVLKSHEERKAMNINLDLIKDVIESVEDIFQKENLHLPPKKKAELIALLYEEILEDESKKDRLEGRVLRLVKLAS